MINQTKSDFYISSNEFESQSLGGMSDDPPGEKSPADWSSSLVMPPIPSDTPPGDKPPGDQKPDINLAEESFPSSSEFRRSDKVGFDSIDTTQGYPDLTNIDHTHSGMDRVMSSTDTYDNEITSAELDQTHAEMESFMNPAPQQDSSLDQVHEQMHQDMDTQTQPFENASLSQASDQGFSQSDDL